MFVQVFDGERHFVKHHRCARPDLVFASGLVNPCQETVPVASGAPSGA